MKHFWLLTISMMVLFLLLFGVAQWLHIPVLVDPGPWLKEGGYYAAAVGIGLLVIDVLLPTPASLIMIAHGATFGVALGTLVSLIGGLGATWVGFFIGRRGGPLLARIVPEDERCRAEAMLRRWGVLAIIVTRPIPILAETTAILAGTSSVTWARLTFASIAGLLPACFLYALTGATAFGLDNSLLIFALVIGVAGIVWFAGRRVSILATDNAKEPGPAAKQ